MGITGSVMERQTPSGLTLPLPSPLLAMLPSNLQGKPMQWWAQPANALNVAALSPGVAQFVTDSNHYFAAWYGCVSVRAVGDQTDLTLNFPTTLTLTDVQNLNYGPPAVPNDLRNVFGSAAQPAIWPMPLIIAPNSGLIVTLQNLHATQAANYRFTWLGALILSNN